MLRPEKLRLSGFRIRGRRIPAFSSGLDLRFIRIWRPVVLAALIWLGISSVTSATSILVSPARIEAQVSDGSRLPSLRVRNTGDRVVNIRAYVGSGRHDATGAPVYSTEVDEPHSVASLKLTNSDFSLEPGQTQEIRLTPVVPEGYRGGFYPVVFVEASSPVEEARGISSNPTVAVLTLLTAGEPNGSLLEIGNLDVTQESPGTPIKISFNVSNHGDVHGLATGFLDIRTSDGIPLEKLGFNPVTVLPGCMRTIEVSWTPNSILPGDYRVTANLGDNGSEPLVFASADFSVSAPYELARISGEVVRFDVSTDPVSGALEYSVLFRNTGNVVYSPDLEVLIMDGGGRVVDRTKLISNPISPNRVAELNGTTPNPLPEGLYSIRLDLHEGNLSTSLVELDYFSGMKKTLARER